MRLNAALLPVLRLCATGVWLSAAPRQSNPLAGDRSAITEGASLFRADCSWCHGLNAKGGARGPDLTQARWAHGGTDDALFRTIVHGVAGTEMPANSLQDRETWALIAYIRSLGPLTPAKLTGDAGAGKRLFFGKSRCATCHMIQGKGGHLGPDLSRVGAARSVPYFIESIRDPDKELSVGYSDPNNHYGVPLEYDTVVVVTREGKRIVGVAKNEDAFSIQLLGRDDELHLFSKKDLASVRHEQRSLMPAYDFTTLSSREEQDLVAYLSTLRGGSP